MRRLRRTGVDVYARECKQTNKRGAATIEFDAERNTDYLVRVGARESSADDRFTLRVVAPDNPATFPGSRLPRRGARAVVDRLGNPDDSWALRVRKGRTYRLNLVSSGGRCVTAELFDNPLED